MTLPPGPALPPPSAVPAGRLPALLAAALLIAGLALLPSSSPGQEALPRQVTLFGIRAIPTGANTPLVIDPKLQPIEAQLRRLFPNHSFELVGVETQRVPTGRSMSCNFGSGYAASVQLTNPLDLNGKAQLRFQLNQNGAIDFATIVNTPLNQLFFLDKRLADGSKLIMGLGVRE